MRIETDSDIAKRIRLERQCLSVDGDPWKIDNLCSVWNWATSPSIARSDRAHRVCRHLARQIRAKLDGLGNFHETESGRLVPGYYQIAH